MSKRVVAAVVSVLAFLSLSLAATPAASEPARGGEGRVPPEAPGRAAAFRALDAEARRSGRVEALIALDEAGLVPGNRSAADPAARQRGIERAGDRVLTGLAGTDFEVLYQYENIPYVAVSLSRGALQRLERLDAVAAVGAIPELKPLLHDSVPAIQAPAAHALGYGGEGQLVAVVDDGVETSPSGVLWLPELAERVVHEACFNSDALCPNGQTSDEGPGSAAPPCWFCVHGTAVASVASAVAPDTGIFAINIATPTFLGATGSMADLLAALDYLFEFEPDLPLAAVNLSWGFPVQYQGDDCDGATEPMSGVGLGAMRDAVDNLAEIGVATVVAAGNDGDTTVVMAPACLSNVVTVAGTEADHQTHASYSNSSPEVELWAPAGGENECEEPRGLWIPIPPALLTLLEEEQEEPVCLRVAGTSFAAPHVAGAFAVVAEALDDIGADVDPEERVAAILGLLEELGDPYTDPRNGVTRPRLQLGPVIEHLLDAGPLAGASLHVMTPARLVDTTDGTGTCNGAPCGRLNAGGGWLSTERVRIPVAGVAGVPTGARAVQLQVAAFDAGSSGLLTVNPTGDGLAAAALLPFTADLPAATSVTAQLDAAGSITIDVHHGATDLLVEVVGWYDDGAEPGGLGYNPVEPARVLDTTSGSPLEVGSPVRVQVTGSSGVPANGVDAVVLHLTADGDTTGIVGIAADAGTPQAAWLVFGDDRPGAEVAVVPLDAAGGFLVESTADVEVTADVVGWFGEPSGSGFSAADRAVVVMTEGQAGTCLPDPCDTLDGTADVRFQVTGVAGIPSQGVDAVVLHVLAGNVAGATTLELGPSTGAAAASITFGADESHPRSTYVVVAPDDDGYVTLRADGPIDVAAFAIGWFGAGPPAA